MDKFNRGAGADIFEFSFVTSYSNQYYDIKKILEYWKILKNYSQLGPEYQIILQLSIVVSRH